MYLESSPREDFIKTEIERLNRIIDSLETSYAAWVVPKEFINDPTKARSEFRREMGITKMKTQIKALRFLLN